MSTTKTSTTKTSTTSAGKTKGLHKGLKIGLFPGSFDPPHAGHLLVAQQMQKKLGLDAVWWLVTPLNPFKSAPDRSVGDRIALCDKLFLSCGAPLKNFIAFDLDTKLGTSTTYDMLTALIKRDKRHFTLMLGADTANQLHKWHRGKDIPRLLPLAVYPRPPLLYPRLVLRYLALNRRHTCVTLQREAKQCSKTGASPLHFKLPCVTIINGATSILASSKL